MCTNVALNPIRSFIHSENGESDSDRKPALQKLSTRIEIIHNQVGMREWRDGAT